MGWTEEVSELVAEWLPAPARLLEVGCGTGELALRLERDGYHVLAIDPRAPDGPIFRRTTLEELAAAGTFDAVVANRSLHHVRDLETGLDKISRLLRPGGVLVLNEFAPDRADAATVEWCARLDEHHPDASLEHWRARYADVHGHAAISAALRPRFEELLFRWHPHMGLELGRPDVLASERELIAAGRIRALGYQYVGLRSAADRP
jgi:SAM-dependent methyltransferase